jgi:hypothetical protein
MIWICASLGTYRPCVSRLRGVRKGVWKGLLLFCIASGSWFRTWKFALSFFFFFFFILLLAQREAFSWQGGAKIRLAGLE